MALIGLVLGAPDAVQIFRDNALGLQRPDEKEFAQSPELWAAVRGYATPAARVANNPLFVQGPNAVAGQHLLGAARRPQFMFCRP